MRQCAAQIRPKYKAFSPLVTFRVDSTQGHLPPAMETPSNFQKRGGSRMNITYKLGLAVLMGACFAFATAQALELLLNTAP